MLRSPAPCREKVFQASKKGFTSWRPYAPPPVRSQDSLYVDFTFLHPVTPAHLDVRARPAATLQGQASVLLRRHCRAGIVHVNELPAVPGPFIDLRFPTVRLNRCAVFALFGGEVPIELRPRGFSIYVYGNVAYG